MSFSPLKPTSPPDEDVRASEIEVSGVDHRSTVAKVLGTSEADVVPVLAEGLVDAEAAKDFTLMDSNMAMDMQAAKDSKDSTTVVGEAAPKDGSGVMTGAVGRSGVVFVPKVAQGKLSTGSITGVGFAKAVAHLGGGFSSRGTSDHSTSVAPTVAVGAGTTTTSMPPGGRGRTTPTFNSGAPSVFMPPGGCGRQLLPSTLELLQFLCLLCLQPLIISIIMVPVSF